MQRSSPRSTTGRGMAGYRRWCAGRVLPCARPSGSSTPWGSMRSSLLRSRATVT